MNFMFSCHSNIKFISSRYRVISSIYPPLSLPNTFVMSVITAAAAIRSMTRPSICKSQEMPCLKGNLTDQRWYWNTGKMWSLAISARATMLNSYHWLSEEHYLKINLQFTESKVSEKRLNSLKHHKNVQIKFPFYLLVPQLACLGKKKYVRHWSHRRLVLKNWKQLVKLSYGVLCHYYNFAFLFFMYLMSSRLKEILTRSPVPESFEYMYLIQSWMLKLQ